MRKTAKVFNFVLILFLTNPCACYAQGTVSSPIIKFSWAMLGVLISSVVIFISLKIYQKLALKNSSKSDTIDYEKTLESPKDFKEAINLFLSKTDR